MIVKGQKIDGRYQIIRTIGEGGMANVYLAYDTILDREVAVKILRGDLANDEKFVHRFQREAKAASSLNHPNIVEMYDVGEDDGNYFIVMEYVNGKTLKSLIKKRGALSLSEVIDIMLQLTSAIACAHDSYIIHRDIKPQNVLILEDGRVKITDFGIAIALNSNELTQTNSVMGSVHYLPPEQANGKGATIKSDIYSLGILMYELLTGKLPFKGENAVEIAIKQMKEKIPSVCERNPEIPQSIENIVFKACAKNPKNRYDSVAEMHEDLKTALDGERRNEERLVYRYAEQDLDETREISNLSEIKATSKRREDRTEEEPEENKNSKLKKILLIVGSILSALIIIISVIAIVSINKGKRATVTLPDIENKSKDAVEEKLINLGLEVDFEEEESEEIEEGKAIGYKSGKADKTKVKKGSQITVLISSGLSGIELEDYTGKNIEVVEIELQNAGIRVVKTPRKISSTDSENGEVFEGMIVDQDKKEGTRVSENGVVELFYATLITVYPDFTIGYNKDSIQAFCDDNGITCQFEEEESTQTPGTILSQSRAAGVEVKTGVTLVIKIAKAKEVDKQDNDDDNNITSGGNNSNSSSGNSSNSGSNTGTTKPNSGTNAR